MLSPELLSAVLMISSAPVGDWTRGISTGEVPVRAKPFCLAGLGLEGGLRGVGMSADIDDSPISSVGGRVLE